jgi:hypothetical protein
MNELLFDFINNLTLAPTIRAMLNHERWQQRLVELLLSLSLSPIPFSLSLSLALA